MCSMNSIDSITFSHTYTFFVVGHYTINIKSVGSTKLQKRISINEHCFVNCRYLATGDSFRSLGFRFRVGFSTVAGIVNTVATAIWDCLVAEYMPVPTGREWKEIAENFHRLWNFPNCLGTIDGKHVQIQAPASTGSLLYNYKGHFSVVLLAVVDAHYHFRVIDVGAYGNSSDGGTLAASAFGKALYSQTLQLPADVPLHGAEDQSPVPHVFVADKAFPLRRELMLPGTEEGVQLAAVPGQEDGGMHLWHSGNTVASIPESSGGVSTGCREGG